MIDNNRSLKEYLHEIIMDKEILDQIIVLEGNEFAPGAIRITNDNRLVYGYERLVESLAKEYGSEEDAREWLEYNTIRALPYMERDGLAPVIIYEFDRG